MPTQHAVDVSAHLHRIEVINLSHFLFLRYIKTVEIQVFIGFPLQRSGNHFGLLNVNALFLLKLHFNYADCSY
ncbi:hypothetical protein D3C73_1588890 [compost metagenome]